MFGMVQAVLVRCIDVRGVIIEGYHNFTINFMQLELTNLVTGKIQTIRVFVVEL